MQAGLQDLTDVIQGDFHAMPFPDNSFDAIVSVEATCHASSVRSSLQSHLLHDSPVIVMHQVINVPLPSGVLFPCWRHRILMTACPYAVDSLVFSVVGKGLAPSEECSCVTLSHPS
jgi:hypothetical protein